MKISEAYQRIMNWLTVSEHEGSRSFYLPKAVVIGSNSNGDVLCTYVNESSEGGFYLNVIFNERDCEIYGRNYDFTFLVFGTPDTQQWEYTGAEQERFDITLKENALELILEGLSIDWMAHQMKLRIDGRAFHRRCVSKDGAKFTWQEKVEWYKNRIEVEQLAWNRKNNDEIERLNDMLLLGPIVYAEKYRVQDENMRKILNEILGETEK